MKADKFNLVKPIEQIKQVIEQLDIKELYDLLVVRCQFGVACG